MVLAEMKWDEWHEQNSVGFNLTSIPITFSKDNKVAVMVSLNHLIIVDVVSGKRLKILSRSSSQIVHTCINNENKLFAYSVDGWQYGLHLSDGNEICNVKLPVETILACRHHSDGVHVHIVSKNRSCELEWRSISIIDLSCRFIMKTGVHNIGRNQLTLEDDYLIVAEGLFVQKYCCSGGGTKHFKFKGKITFMENSLVEFVNVVSCSEFLAAALSFGRLFVWNNIMRNESLGNFLQSIHWHKSAPSMVLTTSGSLITAGGEGVINKYIISRTKANEKATFLPRMQAPIVKLSISEDASILAAALADNSVHFIALCTMTVMSTAQTILLSPQSSSIPLTIDPAYPQYAVWSARPGVVQWFDPHTMLTVVTADISRQNPVDGKSLSHPQPIGYIDISAIAFSYKMVATAERHINLPTPMNRIQFWRRRVKVGSIALEFSVHNNGEVIMLRACLENDFFLSVDSTGCICFWERVSNETSMWHSTKQIQWMRSEIIHGSQIRNRCISLVHKIPSDKCVLVLWNTADHHTDVVPNYVHQGDFKFIASEWCAAPYSHLLLVAASTHIAMFDTLRRCFLWVMDKPQFTLGVTSQFPFTCSAAFEVTVYSARSAAVLKLLQLCGEPKSILGIGSGEDFQIVVEYEEEIFVISKRKMMTARDTLMHEKATPFSDLFNGERKDVDSRKLAYQTEPALEMVTGAAHTLAPISQLAKPFIKSCFLP